jgi:hypothetical protein
MSKMKKIEFKRNQNYVVVNEEKKVYAKIGNLKEEEMKAVLNYKTLGFEVIPYEEPKKEPKETNSKLTAEAVQKYLKEHGTKEQQNKYWEIYNEQATDENGNPLVYKNNVYKTETIETGEKDENGKPKTKTKRVKDENGKNIILYKKGEPRKKGHIATLHWFKETFPEALK